MTSAVRPDQTPCGSSVPATDAAATDVAPKGDPVKGDVRWLSSSERAGWLALGALVTRLPAALDADLQATADISLFDYMVLAHLSEAPGRALGMSELGPRVNASPSRLSHGVARLERRGWVCRAPLPEDGRHIVARLTAAGHRKIVGSAPKHVGFVRRVVIDALSADEVEQLHTIARTIVASIDDELAGCSRRTESPDCPPTPCSGEAVQPGQCVQEAADGAPT